MVGAPGVDGAEAGGAGRFGRGAQRVVPESSMHAARSIASWLGPDGSPGPVSSPGPPSLQFESVPGSVLGYCWVPEMVREEPSVEPQSPIRRVSGEQPVVENAVGDVMKPRADAAIAQAASLMISMGCHLSAMHRRSIETDGRPL